MEKCDKCKSDANGKTVTCNEKTFHLCNLCSIILSNLPPDSIDSFMQKDYAQKDIYLLPITKNILAAKERRIRGESPWVECRL